MNSSVVFFEIDFFFILAIEIITGTAGVVGLRETKSQLVNYSTYKTTESKMIFKYWSNKEYEMLISYMSKIKL